MAPRRLYRFVVLRVYLRINFPPNTPSGPGAATPVSMEYQVASETWLRRTPQIWMDGSQSRSQAIHGCQDLNISSVVVQARESPVMTPRLPVARLDISRACTPCQVTFQINSKNAQDVIFSSRTGLACGLNSDASGLQVDNWSVATAASCLVAVGKQPKLLNNQSYLATKATMSALESLPRQWCLWVANHYRWVVWKLAAVSRHFSVNRLTFKRVLSQLKWRFEQEIELSNVPALRAICRRAAAASHFLVLAVSEVQGQDSERRGLIELTDGWYSVDAMLDAQLTSRCACGQIHVGTKLAIQGAKLIGDSAEAIERDPLNFLLHARRGLPLLSINFNGTRLAQSSVRLGFQERGAKLAIPLPFVQSLGGAVPVVDAIVRHVCLRSENAGAQHSCIPSGVITLIARDKTGSPLTAKLYFYDNGTHTDSYGGLQEGDEVRVYHTVAIAHSRGSLVLESTPETRYTIKHSPAFRNLLAGCGCAARVFLDGATLADLGQDSKQAGSRVDYIGFVVAIQEGHASTTIVLHDMSPNLLFLTRYLESDLDASVSDLAEGSQVAVLNGLLLRTRNNAALLDCDKFGLLCSTQHTLSKKVSAYMARSDFDTRWEALASWARSHHARETTLRACAQLKAYTSL